ncbi:hypothetical protein KQX54_003644 [Cotesia glomerata]|uniref:Uncharacterized protein n=1 Tax=Cotesia glomerata TaxID=32391 RepID=A0AAV7IL65_COTGL|nr:hypothetical protein KQX54_003644 [Cotesia glomerata]
MGPLHKSGGKLCPIRTKMYPIFQNSNSNLEECEEKWPRLHVAVWHGFYSIVEGMIITGTPADSFFTGPIGRGFTALHLAALKNQYKCAEVLLECGASVSPKTGAICDPIHIAVFKNHQEMAALLFSHGCDVNVRFSDGFFELFHHEMLSDLWKDHDLPLLHCSILLKQKEMTEIIINRSADIKLKTRLGKTTLMQAVEVNNADLVKHFLKRGADVNDRDSFGQPVLHFVVHNAIKKKFIFSGEENKNELKNKKMEIVKCLVEAGADVNAKFPECIPQSTVLHYMILYGFSGGVKYLLDCCDLDWIHVDLQTVIQKELMIENANTTYLSQSYLRELKQAYAFIMFLIEYWSISRQVLGLPVYKTSNNRPIHNRDFQNLYANKLVIYRHLAETFVDVLKDVKVRDTNISFYHLLTCGKEEIVTLSAKLSVSRLDGVGSQFKMKFDHPLGLMLIRRLIWANKTRRMRKQATEVLACLFFGTLPYDCCQFIVKYFNNKELIKIISLVNGV